MKYLSNIILISILICAILVMPVSGDPFSAWTNAGGCWTATNDTYTLVMWNATGTDSWTPPTGITNVDYLDQAGGGGGGYWRGGGGGAGGVLAGTSYAVIPGTPVIVTVGIGGPGGTSVTNEGTNGGHSIFGTIDAPGGGGGGSAAATGNGKNGGSGGGANAAYTPGTGITGQGFAGGTGNAFPETSGGGGGNTSTGYPGDAVNSGNGGDGGMFYITGTGLPLAAGGGAGIGSALAGTFGLGGSVGGTKIGGDGSKTGAGSDAIINTGSGGGGGTTTSNGGAGSSGLIIIKYLTAVPAPDTNPYSNLKFGSPLSTANQTNGGFSTRIIQIKNITDVGYVSGIVLYNPLHEYTQASWIRLNNSYYPTGLTLNTASVNPSTGQISFKVTKDGVGFNAGTDLVSFLDIDLLYYGYEPPGDPAYVAQNLSSGTVQNLTTSTTFPVNILSNASLTFGSWDFTTDVVASSTSTQVGIPVTFHAPWSGAYPNMWNWSLGGHWINGTTVNTTSYTFTSAGTKDISVYAMLAKNVSVVSSVTKLGYVTITGGAELSLVPKPKTINYGIPSNVTVQVKNISHTDNILTNVTFNKSILHVTDIFPANTGDLSIASYNNAEGYATINLSTTDRSYPTNTSIAYIQFNTTIPTISNTTEPLNLVQQTGFIVNSSYAPPNLYMFVVNNSGAIEPENNVLTQIFNFIRVDTGNLLSTIQITNVWDGVTSGTAYTTTGSQTISSTWGFINLTSTANAFYSSNLYQIEINGGTTTVYMTPFVSSQTQTTFYSPHQVVFQIVDSNYNPITSIHVTANAVSTTLPGGSLAGATGVLQSAYGISSSLATTMLNSVTTYAGTTDSAGYFDVLMISTIQYQVAFTDPMGNYYSELVYPQDSYYQIKTTNSTTPSIFQQGVAANTNLSASVFVVNMTENSALTLATLRDYFYDATGQSQGLNCWFEAPNGTVFWQNTTFAYGAGLQTCSLTVPTMPYTSWKWGFQSS